MQTKSWINYGGFEGSSTGGRGYSMEVGSFQVDGHVYTDVIRKEVGSYMPATTGAYHQDAQYPFGDYGESFRHGRHIRMHKQLTKLKELKHPNVLPILHVELNGQTAFVYSPKCNAGDLGQLLGHPKHPGWFTQKSNRQCLMLGAWRGLDYLHNKMQMMHYDIKPANIFIHFDSTDLSPRAVIGDVDDLMLFQSCIRYHRDSKMYNVGTPAWGSPFGTCDPEVDTVPLVICTFLCLYLHTARNVWSNIVSASIKRICNGSEKDNCVRLLLLSWGWWPTAVDFDINTYTYKVLAAHISELEGNDKISGFFGNDAHKLAPSGLINALSDSELRRTLWVPNRKLMYKIFCAWLSHGACDPKTALLGQNTREFQLIQDINRLHERNEYNHQQLQKWITTWHRHSSGMLKTLYTEDELLV